MQCCLRLRNGSSTRRVGRSLSIIVFIINNMALPVIAEENTHAWRNFMDHKRAGHQGEMGGDDGRALQFSGVVKSERGGRHRRQGRSGCRKSHCPLARDGLFFDSRRSQSSQLSSHR